MSKSIIPTRTVKFTPRQPFHKERMNLLTYRMALAQPGATVPLLSSAGGAQSGTETSLMSTTTTSASVEQNRRWVRDADELCVASVHRSNSINHINTYVASYKFDDPQWQPFLLPEVQVFASEASSSASSSADGSSGRGGGAAAAEAVAAEVHIDYNKLVTLELISRHANYALRHLVQKGHAMYFVNFAQHSLLHMRGLVETSHITCAFGVRGERLRTYITHIGPLDVRDVIEVDPRTRRVSFNLHKRGVRRGVVALSQVEGYGTWFQRKPMLWQRTRRIGALQSTLGAFGYDLCSPASVGRQRDCEVSLLAPHLRFFGASGGGEAVGIIADSQVAQNSKLYVGQFEAPPIAAVDAVHQLAHAAALQQSLVTPAAGHTPLALARAEQLLPVSWVTRTPPPYVPLESDLPFKMQISRPTVFAPPPPGSAGGAVYPHGGSVGTPFVVGAPISLMEYNILQGVDHYVYDEAPSARPLKWWNQKSNTPFNGHLYFVRSRLLDRLQPSEHIANPIAKGSRPSRPQRHRRRRQPQQQTEAETEAEAGTERWAADARDLVGHDPETLAAAAQDGDGDGDGRARVDHIVPPSSAARRRMDRYEAAAAGKGKGRTGAVALEGSASARSLRRRMRVKKSKRHAKSSTEAAVPGEREEEK